VEAVDHLHRRRQALILDGLAPRLQRRPCASGDLEVFVGRELDVGFGVASGRLVEGEVDPGVVVAGVVLPHLHVRGIEHL